MNAPSNWRRRLALKLAQHASRVLPGSGPWADAIRHELDHIENDADALYRAVGGLLASYRARLVQLRRVSMGASFRYLGTASVLMLLIGFALARHASGQPEPLRTVFEETACDIPGVSPQIAPRLRCGTVSVPRNYDNPGEGRFRLAVVVVKSAQQPALPEPVVYVSGGPGSPLTVYADHQARTPYAPDRDLILVDQRGTGRSEPKLCPDLDDQLLDSSLAVATDPNSDALARRRRVYAACHAEAITHGIDLRDFGTSVTVADFEWVRRALGIERWNVYGESYGTTVAMTLVALHPESARAAVLDSVYLPDPRPMQSANVADALDALFRYCAGEQVCATAYPGLAATYRDTVSELARSPLIVAVPPQMHQPGDRVSLTATMFEALVGQLIYYSSGYPGLPRLIATVHDRNSQGLGTAIASAVAKMAAEVNHATYLAVECRDRPHFRTPLQAGASVLDLLQPYGVCNDLSELGPAPLVPIGTAVPTLVLAGEFDPVARPSQSQHVTEQIGAHAHWVEFPRIGHNVRGFSPCGSKIAADFIDNPAQTPDISCANRAAPIRFLPR